MEQNIMIIWLAAGIVLLVAEMLLPGVGLLFGGFGALTVGMLLNFSLIQPDDRLLQALVFVSATALWAVALWKPLQKLKIGRNKTQYNNIIGEIAVVGGAGLRKAGGGEVVWSGASMRAKLHEHSLLDSLEAGSQVVIKEINGNVLTVIPKI